MATTNNDRPRQEFKDLAMWRMYADAPDAPGLRSSLRWGTLGANPRITVSTNVPADKTNKFGLISAAFNPETFMILLQSLEDIAKGENGQKMKFDCLTTILKDDGSRSEPFLNSEVLIGKDDSGLVWISVLSKDRPKIRFIFTVSDFHKIYKSGGVPINESEASVLQATAVARSLRHIFSNLTSALADKFDPKTKTFSPVENDKLTPNPVDIFEDITM